MALSQGAGPGGQAARHISASEQLQSSVLEVLEEGVLVVDSSGRLLQANRAACAILGFDSASALPGPEWWRSLAVRRSDDRSPLAVGATVLTTGRGVRDVLVDAACADGRTVVLSVNYQPLRDEGGSVSGLVLSLRDVTERDAEHHRLVESQERLREAHEVARLASWEWRPETDDVLVVQALSTSHLASGSCVGLDALLGDMPPEERSGVRDDIRSIVDGKRDHTTRRSCLSSPSGPIWMEIRARAVRDGDGHLRCIRGTSQEVTEHELAEQRATAERDFLQATLDSISSHIAVLDDEGDIVMTNRSWDGFGAANGALASQTVGNYFAACGSAGTDEWAVRAVTGLRAILAGTEAEFSLEYPCHSPTVERWFLMRAARFGGSGTARVVVVHDDVTKRRQAEAQVVRQAALLDQVDAAVIATDADNVVTHWNRGAERLYGWTAAEAVGRDLEALGVSPRNERPSGATRGALTDDPAEGWEGDFVARRKDGSCFPSYMRQAVTSNWEGATDGLISVSVDMSDRVAAERALLAARDYMRAVADSMGDGLYTLDSDGLLTYMNSAAETLLGWSNDELRGRLMHDVIHTRRRDGSELAIEDCPAVSDRRTVRVDDDIFIRSDGNVLPVSYTAAPFETGDGVEGSVVVFKDITEQKARQQELERDADKFAWTGRIRRALAEDRLVLYQQPIVSLADGQTVQSELLVRMRAPDGAIIGPSFFLPVAEESGLITEIDRWVIHRGIAMAASGRAVEINLSGRSMGDKAILAHIESCLSLCRADPGLIVFETTETAIVEHIEAARTFAERLHLLGCKVALDDFGTGYGGFTYLKQIPVDYLKIDIEFVRDLLTNAASRHVVEAVVALARRFELQTVAEGVEDEATYGLLRALGVDFAQGYHIGRPAPIPDEEAPS